MRLSVIFLLSLLLTGCGFVKGDDVVGSGDSKTERREVSSFSSIETSGAFDVEVVCQQEPSLELEGDDNLLPLIKTEVRGGTLYIKPEKNFSVRRPIRVRITVQNIESVSSSGAGRLDITRIKNEKLRIENSGAAQVTLSGQTTRLDLELSGASKADTENLIAANVTVNLSGAGKANVYASEELNAEVSGAGSVTYSGNPKTVNPKISGVGSISKK